MKLSLCMLLIAVSALGYSQTARQRKPLLTLGDAFSRAGLKSLYAIRDRVDHSYEDLENAEVESNNAAEKLMLNNLRAFDVSLSLLSQVEVFTFQAGIGQPLLATAPRDKVALASECYQILEKSFKTRSAVEWPKQCALKP